MLENIQEPSGHGSVQAAVDGPAWAEDYTRWPLEVHSCLNHSDSVTPWNYKSGSIGSYRGKTSIIWYCLQVFWCLLYFIGLSDIIILSFHPWHQCNKSLYSCYSLEYFKIHYSSRETRKKKSFLEWYYSFFMESVFF